MDSALIAWLERYVNGLMTEADAWDGSRIRGVILKSDKRIKKYSDRGVRK